MRILTITKRRTSKKDLITDRFGRYFHLPHEWSRLGSESLVLAADYRGRSIGETSVDSCRLVSIPLSSRNPISYWSEVESRAKDFRPDIVFGGGDTHLGWIGRRLAHRLNVPLAFDVFDNYESFSSARIPGMKRVFHSLAEDADLTVLVTGALADLLENSNRLCVVPNGVDMDLFRPGNRDASKPGFGTIAYVGGLAGNRGTNTLVNAIDLLRGTEPNVMLVVAGPLLDGYKFPDRDWIDYRGIVSQREVAGILAAADVAVLPYPDTDWARYTSAYKLREYLACEVPVVTTDISDYRSLAAAPEAVCRPDDPEDMARALEFQLRHSVIVERDESWSWRSRASDLLQEFEKLG